MAATDLLVEPVSPDSHGETRVDPGSGGPLNMKPGPAALATVAAAGIALFAQVLLNNRIAFLIALPLALGAGFLALLASRGAPSLRGAPPIRMSRNEVALVLGLLALGYFLRIWHNAEFPIGITYDEATNGLEATELMQHPRFPLWSDALSGRPTVHLHLLALAFAIFSPTPEALRGVSAFIGTLTLLPVYLLGRYAGGVRVGAAAMAFLTISRWSVEYGRLGYEAIFGPPCAAFAIYFFVRAWHQRQTLWFALCGFALAAGLYTYVAFRLFPFAIGAMALIALLRDWQTGGARRALWTVRGLAMAAVTFLIVTAPLLNFARTDWARFSHRFEEVSVFNEMRSKDSMQPLVENVLRHVGMFNYRGGIRAATSLPFGTDPWQPGYPMLGIPFAAFFLVGFFRGVRRLGTPLGMGMFATLLTSLTAGALTVTLETPHQTRALIAVIPAAFYAGEGLVATAQSLAALIRRMPRAAPACISIVLILAAIAEGETYRRQLLHPEASWDYDAPTNRAAQLIRALPADTKVIVSSSLTGFPSDNIIRFVSGRDLSTLEAFDPFNDLPVRDTSKPVAFILTPASYETIATGFEGAYPDIRPTLDRDRFDRIQAIEYDLSATQLAGALGLRNDRYTSADCDGNVLAMGNEPGPRFGENPVPSFILCEQWTGVLSVPRTGSYQVLISGGSATTATLDGTPVDDRPRDIVAGFASLTVRRQLGESAQTHMPWSIRLVPVSGGTEAPPMLFARPALARGLVGSYYKNARYEGDPIAVRRDWSLLPAGLAPGPYSIIWQGFLDAPTSGRYSFFLTGDDGAQLSIDGVTLLDASVADGHASVEKELGLEAGKHRVELKFHNAEGGQSLELDWITPEKAVRERVPLAALSPY